VSGANAAFVNQFDFSFNGSDAVGASPPAFLGGTVAKVDVNQETEDVYVGTTNGRIYKFGANGASKAFGGLGANTVFNQSFGTWGDIEVDNSGTATNGRFYTANDSSSFWGFAADGTALPGYPVNNSGETCGLAVGPEGHIYAGVLPSTIREYEPTNPPTLVKSISLSPTPSAMCDFDMDAAGNFLVPAFYGGGVVRKYKPDGSSGVVIDSATTSRTVAADWSNNHIYVDRQNSVFHYDSLGGSPLDSFGFADPPYPGLSSSPGIAVNETTHAVYVANNGAEARVDVFKPVQVPDVTTGGSEGNSKVLGTVDPAGAGEITQCYFEFGTTTSYELGKEDCVPAAPFNSIQNVSAELPGLVGEQTYHYRLVAHNASGKGAGGDQTITPHYVVGLQTDPAEDVTRTSAKMNAHFVGNGEATDYYFEWGTSTSYGEESAVPPGVSAGSPAEGEVKDLTFDASGLNPDTEYHYRVVATNAQGTSPGNDRTFKTLPAVQSLTTLPATNVTGRAATLNASYVGDGDSTTYHFEYGKTISYGSTTPVQNPGAPTGSTPLSTSITGLDLETTYHYRVVATNSLGTTKGPDLTFATNPAVAGLQTLPASDISQTGVQLNAEFEGNGDNTTYYFQYGLTSAYGKTTAPAPGDDAGSPIGLTPVSATIIDFEAYTTYHYRVVATNSEGTTIGNDMTFETLPAPLPGISGQAASDVTPTSATLQADINPNRWATVYAFEYGPSSAYGETTEISSVIGNDQFDHSVDENISNLEPGTVYHFRVVAINFTGTAYGPDQTFVTPAAPEIIIASASAIGQGSASLSASVNPKSSPTSVRFEYGPTPAYGSSTATIPAGSGSTPQNVGADIGGLSGGTTYHFRVIAQNGHGTTVGFDQTFTTLASSAPAPLIQPSPKRCRRGFVRRNGKCVRKRCKKGFVKRNGKCVRKPKRHSKRNRRGNGRNG
jgi:phosphodiesterase/alkaline phosphatase D-like protein